MYVAIHHAINDPQKWEKTKQSVMAKIEGGDLPAGVKPLIYLPAANQTATFCVWEADSIETVKRFVDRESGTAARNEYFEIDTKDAMGLPEVAAATR
jgi:hypothetical protein